MVSYAAIDRIEGNFVVMEVEKIPKENSRYEDFDKETVMVDVNIQLFHERFLIPKEGDVFSVEHDGENVLKVLNEEIAEKQRRVEILSKYCV